MVVAPPARTRGRFHLKYRVNHFQRIHNERIVGPADSMTHQLKEPRVHDFCGREDGLRARGIVGDEDVSPIGIFLGVGIIGPLRRDPDIMPSHAGQQSSLRGDCPALDMAFQKIGVFLEVLRRRLVAFATGETGGADQG